MMESLGHRLRSRQLRPGGLGATQTVSKALVGWAGLSVVTS